MTDFYSTRMVELDSPMGFGAAVTPHDTNNLATFTRGLWVGGAGTLRVTLVGGSQLDFAGVPAGILLPLRVQRVHATGTTATGIVALW